MSDAAAAAPADPAPEIKPSPSLGNDPFASDPVTALPYLLARLKEPSTWATITAAMVGLGINLPPGAAQNITAVGTAVAGLLGILLRERVTHNHISLIADPDEPTETAAPASPAFASGGRPPWHGYAAPTTETKE